jgi:hypothetical protein
MLTRVNPFVGSALHNAKLSLAGVSGGTLFVDVSDRLTPDITAIWSEIIIEKSLKVALKYGRFLPEKILLKDINSAIFPINIFPEAKTLKKR